MSVERPEQTSLRRGVVIAIDDRVTGFDLNKRGRPYLIVRTAGGDPPLEILVVPRSTKPGSIGIKTPAGDPPGLDSPGRFLPRPYRVAGGDLETCEVIGELSAQLVAQVVDNTNFVEFD